MESARGKILDLGPGPGNQMDRFIASQVDYIYGIEPNPNFEAQLAKKLNGHALEGKYKVLVCGIEDSDILRGEGITENSVDTVLSIQVMCAVNDPKAVMKEIWKLLKPGGRFIFWEHGKNKDAITATAQGMSIAPFPRLRNDGSTSSLHTAVCFCSLIKITNRDRMLEPRLEHLGGMQHKPEYQASHLGCRRMGEC